MEFFTTAQTGWRRYFWPAIILLSMPLLLLSIAHVSDSDPMGHYDILNLPQGVPHLVALDQITEAHGAAASRLKDAMGTCEVNCSHLEDELHRVDEAFKVLTDPDLRARYDHPERYDKKNYYDMLGVSKDATLEDMRTGYRQRLDVVTGSRQGHDCEGSGADENRDVCSKLAHQLVELQEAANVLGNEDNLRVYLGKGDQKQALDFVTNPLKMVNEHPISFMAPILTLIGVLYYLWAVEFKRFERDQDERQAEAIDAGDDREKTD